MPYYDYEEEERKRQEAIRDAYFREWKRQNNSANAPKVKAADRREMAAAGLPAPVFENRRNEFVVTLYNGTLEANAPAQIDVVNDTQKLLDFCKTPRSRKEIADYLGIGTVFYAMQHYVQPLVTTGQLKMTNPEKPKSRHQKFYSI